MKEKLLFLDLDGTVILPGTFEVPESAAQALTEARRKGHKAIICTGRNMGMIRPLLKYGFDGIIASAGAYIRIGEEVLCDIAMPEEDRKQAFELLLGEGVCMQPESLETLYVAENLYDVYQKIDEDNGDSELIRMRKQIDDTLGTKKLSQYRGEPIYKILYLCAEPAMLDKAEEAMTDRYFFLKHPLDEHGFLHGEIINRKVGKGKALKIVTEYFGKRIEDTIAFGDSMNDAEMFEAAGYRVCMGNGAAPLKEMADYICPDQKEDGLKIAFDKLL